MAAAVTGLIAAPAAFAATGPTCTDIAPTAGAAQAATIHLECSGGSGPLTYKIVAQPGHGTLDTTDLGVGDVSYTADGAYSGTDTFTYQASDTAGGTSNIATATITVTPENSCVSQEFQTPTDQIISIDLLCTSTTGRDETISILNGPNNGSLGVINQANQYALYTPNDNYNGQDTFTFQGDDGVAKATGTITIDVGNVCSDVSVTTEENTQTPIAIPLNCNSPTSLSETYSLAGTPAHGTVDDSQIKTGVVTYTPEPGFSGLDTFGYRGNDGSQNSNIATVTVTVIPLPACQDVSGVTTDENTAVQIPLVCTDSLDRPLTLAPASQPANGRVGNVDPTTDTITYTPKNGFHGVDSFTYDGTFDPGANDSQVSAPATVTVTVTAPPSCSAASATTVAGKPVAVPLSCSDPQGRTLTLSSVSAPTHGTLGSFDQTNQTVTYTPDPGYSGSDSFTYTATAGDQTAPAATAGITVKPVPVCQTVTASTAQNQPVMLHLSCAGGTGALTLSIVTRPPHGTLGSLNQADGSVTYTPASGYTGTDGFTYTATDAAGTAASLVIATVTVKTPPVTSTPTPTPAPTPTPTPTPVPLGSALRLDAFTIGRSATVAGGRAALQAHFSGTGDGTLTLSVTTAGRHHHRSVKPIGTASFSLSGQGVKVISVTLTGAGRSLLKAQHGTLAATVTIVFSQEAHAPMTQTVILKSPLHHSRRHTGH